MYILCVRSGETNASDENLIQGHTDFELNENGRQHAQRIREWCDGNEADIGSVYTSDLSRALETAHIAFPDHNINTDERCREQDYGVVVGELSTFLDDYPEYRLTTPESRFKPFPGGESIADVYHRTVDVFTEILQAHDADETIALVFHFTPMMCLVSYALDEELHETWASEDLEATEVVVLFEENGEVSLADRTQIA